MAYRERIAGAAFALGLLLTAGTATAQSAGCLALNATGIQTNVASASAGGGFTTGETLTGRMIYTPDSGTRTANFRVFDMGSSVIHNHVFATTGISRFPFPYVNENPSFAQWERDTTDGGVQTDFRITCQTATPAITSLSSTSGPAAGGGNLTITGTNVGAVTSVLFGATPATIVGLPSNTEVVVTIPAGVGAQNVTVTDSDGTSGALVYTYLAPPPIPTLSEWAMILLGLVLAGAGGLLVRRRMGIA